MSTNVQFDAKAACDRCGRFGAYFFEGEKLCLDCYEMRASCCAEFGGDDLTTDEASPCAKTDETAGSTPTK